MHELTLRELSLSQKLGFVNNLFVSGKRDNLDFVLAQIRNHAAGSVWVNPTIEHHAEVMAEIKAAADYPLLIICDAESGIDGHFIGRHNAIGMTDSTELAYTFGKVTGIAARALGYNVICDPVIDMVRGNAVCGGTVRSLGCDKEKVAALACAEARGLHDGGVLTVAKHYPGATATEEQVDSHMGETSSEDTAEALLDYNLFPYLALMRAGLLDGIMTKHGRFVNIDPDFPASLSKKVTGILRAEGFDGFMLTDALCMMGVVAKYGRRNSIGLAIAGGNDIALPYTQDNAFAVESMRACYDEGMFDEARLDAAVTRVLEAQHKVYTMRPAFEALTEADLADFDRINRDSVWARTDADVPTALSRDGRHYFAILTEGTVDLKKQPDVDTMQRNWYRPHEIADRLQALFPNSTIGTLPEFPSSGDNWRFLDVTLDYEDVVFVTFINSRAYIGTECLTSRIISLMAAMQVSGRISTVVHFGNPFVLEDIPHIPRLIVGNTSAANVGYTLDVLAGLHTPKGIIPYDIRLK